MYFILYASVSRHRKTIQKIGDAPVTVESEKTEESEADGVREDDQNACFGTAMHVEVRGGGVKRMDEVRVGDALRFGADDCCEVFIVMPTECSVRQVLVNFWKAGGRVLVVSPGHCLHARSSPAAGMLTTALGRF